MMKISTLLQQNTPALSCEVFPPKAGFSYEAYKPAIRKIMQLRPSYISVTFGAGGGSRSNTVEIAEDIQQQGALPALAHLTCVGQSKAEVQEILTTFRAKQIDNVLALRGDLPAGVSAPPEAHFKHASDLIEEIVRFGGFCVGGACYPEGHPEAESLEKDFDYLKQKMDCGCAFLTTQMFFDNQIFYNFMYQCLKRHIDIPVIPGIMPVVNGGQINRIRALSGTGLPQRFRAIVERFGADPRAMAQAGVAYATEQIIDLFANGVRNVHVYTMNRPEIMAAILSNLSDIVSSGPRP